MNRIDQLQELRSSGSKRVCDPRRAVNCVTPKLYKRRNFNDNLLIVFERSIMKVWQTVITLSPNNPLRLKKPGSISSEAPN
jgi:hypothetical protein